MPLGLTGYTTARSGGAAAPAPAGYDPAYGGIPQLPAYTVDTQTTVGEDPWKQWTQIAPGLGPLMQQNVANIGANARGVVNPDVINNLIRQGSERGIAMGSPLSSNANAAYLQAIGLTSNQLQNLAATQTNQLMGAMPTRREQTTTTRTDLAAQQAVYNAAPNPRAAAEEALRQAMAGIAAGKKSMPSAPMQIMPSSPTKQMGYQSYGADPMQAALAWQDAWNRSQQSTPTPYKAPDYSVIPPAYNLDPYANVDPYSTSSYEDYWKYAPQSSGGPYYTGTPEDYNAMVDASIFGEDWE